MEKTMYFRKGMAKQSGDDGILMMTIYYQLRSLQIMAPVRYRFANMEMADFVMI